MKKDSNEIKKQTIEIKENIMCVVKKCIEQDISLSKELKNLNLTYDDLCYENNSKPEYKKQKIVTLDDFKEPDAGIPIISFFSGAGGLDLGFEAVGFKHTLLVEKIPLFCETLKLNRPEWDVYNGDVSKNEEMINEISKYIGFDEFEGVFVGGPPCQSFSIAANQRYSKSGENFKRVGFAHETNGNLLFDYIALIKKFRPKVFLIENVPGLMEIDDGEQLAVAYADLEAAGYKINDPIVLRADHYHVPQQRIRLFIIGSRTDKLLTLPKPSDDSMVCGNVFEMPLGNAINHVTRAHSAESVD